MKNIFYLIIACSQLAFGAVQDGLSSRSIQAIQESFRSPRSSCEEVAKDGALDLIEGLKGSVWIGADEEDDSQIGVHVQEAGKWPRTVASYLFSPNEKLLRAGEIRISGHSSVGRLTRIFALTADESGIAKLRIFEIRQTDSQGSQFEVRLLHSTQVGRVVDSRLDYGSVLENSDFVAGLSYLSLSVGVEGVKQIRILSIRADSEEVNVTESIIAGD